MAGPPDYDDIDRLPRVRAAFRKLGDPLWHDDPLKLTPEDRADRLKLYQGVVAKLQFAKIKIRLQGLSLQETAEELVDVVECAEQADAVLRRCEAERAPPLRNSSMKGPR